MEIRVDSIEWVFCFSVLPVRIPDPILHHQFSAFSGEPSDSCLIEGHCLVFHRLKYMPYLMFLGLIKKTVMRRSYLIVQWPILPLISLKVIQPLLYLSSEKAIGHKGD